MRCHRNQGHRLSCGRNQVLGKIDELPEEGADDQKCNSAESRETSNLNFLSRQVVHSEKIERSQVRNANFFRAVGLNPEMFDISTIRTELVQRCYENFLSVFNRE